VTLPKTLRLINRHDNNKLRGKTTSTPDGIKLLTRLGLTFRQAKVYLTLAKCGVSSVRKISNISRIHREDLYRVLRELQKTGLVEKRITFPITYEAIPVDEALSLLHERRIRETNELQVKEKSFLEKSMSKLASKLPSKDGAQLVLIPEKETVVMRTKKAIRKTKCNIDVVNSPRRHLLSASVFGKEVHNALDRGLKIRVVTQRPEKMEVVPKAQIEVEKKAGFKIRYISVNPSAIVSIFDEEEVFIVVDERADIKSSALWSNNKALVALCKNYFDSLWRHGATEVPSALGPKHFQKQSNQPFI
jgi:sugar-specific transcriptional regulator TrmB